MMRDQLIAPRRGMSLHVWVDLLGCLTEEWSLITADRLQPPDRPSAVGVSSSGAALNCFRPGCGIPPAAPRC